MDPRFKGFLRQISTNKKEDDSAYTLISSLNETKEKWYLRPPMLTDFWSTYCEYADKNLPLNLSEKTNGTAPITIHCKLKFHLNNSDTPDEEEMEDTYYGINFLLQFVKCCQQVIKEKFELAANHEGAKPGLCSVVLKSNHHWIENNQIHTHFRIQFPYCRTYTRSQEQVFRPRLIELLRTTNIMALLKQQPIGDWDTIIDPAIPIEYLPLYGSKVAPNDSPLEVIYLWDEIQTQHLNSSIPPDLELDYIFSPQEHNQCKQQLINPTIFQEDVEKQYWLPLFLSIDYASFVQVEKVEVSIAPPRITPASFSFVGGQLFSLNNREETDLDIAEKLLPLIKAERANLENYWIDIGKALYHASGGEEIGLQLWIQFTERGDTFLAEQCRSYYESPAFLKSNLTVKTIAWYAKQDSPENYRHWHQQWCQYYMIAATSCLHKDIADALYRIYWLEYVCADVNKNSWYRYRSHRFCPNGGIELSRTISGDFLKRFEALRTNISQRCMETEDHDIKDKCESDIKKITNLISKLKTVTFKNNIMKEAREHFYQENFNDKLDSNENLLGMTNCVIETCREEVVIRAGKPEDYISMTTGVQYRDYKWNDPIVIDLLKWFHQVFVDKDLFHYAMKIFASFLRGRNSDKIFHCWSGGGHNSKSMIIKLFETSFGNYIVKIPPELVTTKRGEAGKATPELAQARGARGAIMDEPDDDEPMRKGIIKRYTGGDSFFTRLLHENGGKQEALFKLVQVSNHMAPIPNPDDAIRNRLRILPFLSVWDKKNVPATEEEQFRLRRFPADPYFEDKIPTFASAFIWLLCQYYPIYRKEGLIEPPIVIETTQKYWDDNDCYRMFINECIEEAYLPDGKTIDQKATLSFSELYRLYKQWFSEAYPRVKVADSPVVKVEMEQRLGKRQGRYWLGIRIKKEEDNTAGHILLRNFANI